MWINFASKDKFAIKIHVGGFNAVSGSPCSRLLLHDFDVSTILATKSLYKTML